MKQIFLIIYLLAWSNAFTQRNTIIFEEKNVDSIDQKIDSILLIGIGSTTTRIFLDEVSKALVKKFTEKGIVANYHYLGKNAVEAKSEFDTISKNGYKAVLFFLPNGSSYYDVLGEFKNPLSVMGPIARSSKAKTEYQQDFNFQLCIPAAGMKKVWTASLEVTCDLSKSKNAKYVGTKLLSFFKTNKYIE